MRRAVPWILGIVAASALVGWALSALARGAPGGPPGARAGALLGGGAGAAAFVFALRVREARPRAFIPSIFGGMLLRLLLYGAALVAVHRAGSWSLGWFVAGVLGAHFTGQVIEIAGLVRLPPSAPPGEGPGSEGRTGSAR